MCVYTYIHIIFANNTGQTQTPVVCMCTYTCVGVCLFVCTYT